jgi:hypothetical protein
MCVRHVEPLDVYHHNIARQYAQSWVQLPNSEYLDEDEELDDEDEDEDDEDEELRTWVVETLIRLAPMGTFKQHIQQEN